MDYNKLCVDKLGQYYAGHDIDEFEYFPDEETALVYCLHFIDDKKKRKVLTYHKKDKFFSLLPTV